MPVAAPYLALMALLRWLAVLTSGVLLANFAWEGTLAGKSLTIHVGWFVVAVGLQFFGLSGIYSAVGLLLQTVLAVYLILRWKFNAI